MENESRNKRDQIICMKQAKSYEINMCEGPIISKLLLFAGPLMLSSMLQLLFNAADVIVVGRFAGDNSLAAVGSTSSLINLLVNFFMGLSIGTNVLVARYFGAGHNKHLSDTVHTSMAVSAISGVILALVGFFFSPVILTWMQSPPEVLPLASLYLKIYFLGMPASMIYNFGSAILRAVGDTKRPMLYLALAGVVNVILNLFFVIVCHMDVAGVAIATVISQIISAALVVRCLMKEQGPYRFELKKLAVSRDILGKIFGIGLPASFQGMLFSISNVIIQSSINSFGAIVVAGNSAAQNIEGFVYMGMNAFYQAAISFVGQNVGANKYDRIGKIAVRAEILVVLTGLIMGNAAYFFGNTLLSFYTTSQTVMDAGIVRLAYICIPYFLCGMMDTMVGVLRGMGYAVMPMIVSLIGACGLRLVWIFTFFQMPRFHETKFLYITYPVSWAVTFAAHVVCYLVVKRKLDSRAGSEDILSIRDKKETI